MKIALLGYGKMGHLVEKIALTRGHEIVARFSHHLGIPQDREEDLIQADLAIDFSQASCVLSHLELCLALRKPIVIGTTGWEELHTLAKEKVEKANGSCLYAPNFSIGVYLFQQMIAYAATLFNRFDEYDLSAIEYHHRQKQDQPSGTAKKMTQNLLDNMPRLRDFKFSSVRSGHFPGTHTLHFDSPVDTVTLTHEARSREGFAHGAIIAAEWLFSRRGFFSIDEMMKNLEGCSND